MIRMTLEREKKRWTKTELAKRAGIALATVCAIEASHVTVWPGWKKKLASALELPEADLFAPVDSENTTV
jgi:transcriptional regulator with XRE-family HTH domain